MLDVLFMSLGKLAELGINSPSGPLSILTTDFAGSYEKKRMMSNVVRISGSCALASLHLPPHIVLVCSWAGNLTSHELM